MNGVDSTPVNAFFPKQISDSLPGVPPATVYSHPSDIFSFSAFSMSEITSSTISI